MEDLVGTNDILELFWLMLTNNYDESLFKKFLKEIEKLNDYCVRLSKKDSLVQVIENSDGHICGHYPIKIIIPKIEESSSNTFDSSLYQLMLNSKFARCRSRFVVPVYFFHGKYICRSSTLSGPLEYYGRQMASAAGFMFDGQNNFTLQDFEIKQTKIDNGQSSLNYLRDEDCNLLRRLNVTYILDLMVEYRKVKYWLPVTSSEKVDQQGRYNDFVLLPMPYPGSEFFCVWRDSGYKMRGLYFDWGQAAVEVSINCSLMPKTLMTNDVDWSNYKSWDLYTLTSNYLKLILGLIYEGAGGLLIHCISGWDRTPLFISIIRCLLWADDLAHSSLSVMEILYLTLGYDWFLFGHKLYTRMQLGEEILRFCFQFLSETAKSFDLSLWKVYDIAQLDSRGSDNERVFVDLRSAQEIQTYRQHRLTELSNLFLTHWNDLLDQLNLVCNSADLLDESSTIQLPDTAINYIRFIQPGEIKQNTTKTSGLQMNNINKLSISLPSSSLVSHISNAFSSAASAMSSVFKSSVQTTELDEIKSHTEDSSDVPSS